eukprot:TRINITY_DN10827_c0_g2_i2.p1 TRINITY_DN10827_c0_g2~~TRINITY_DN10827_c0_g2_i2.p1  ORF type:complete len:335 (-),score=84.73 TRINITY_DN10827_c0_g2_i2:26-1030(-)
MCIRDSDDTEILGPLLQQAAEARMRANTVEQKVAHKRKKFKLVVVLPMLPAMEKDPQANESMATIIYWQQSTLFRGPDSLMGRLQNEFPEEDLTNYIGLFNLKTWEFNPKGKAYAGPVYVHSKVMIVDDRIVILGSANINDRSLLGTRDSEMAVVCTPPELVSDAGTLARTTSVEALRRGTFESCMDRDTWTASVFAHKLRVQLWAEHLGLLEPNGHDGFQVPQDAARMLKDPLVAYDSCWVPTAAKNTIAFDMMFPQFPSDQQRNFKQMQAAKAAEEDPTNENEHLFLSEIKGHVTRMPMEFLADESLYFKSCLLYTSPSPRDRTRSRMPSSA